jgi:hypothetical protein
MSDILLNDILQMDKEELKNVRIRLNLSNNSWNAIQYYHENKEKLLIGNFHNSADRIDENGKKIKGKIWFDEGQIVIGLAQINDDDWLLIDISTITKNYHKKWDGKSESKINTFYEHEKIKKYEKYFGRVRVSFHKNNQYVTLKGNKIDNFKLVEILSDNFDNDIFPGYDQVNLSWKELNQVINKDSWKTALQNQKGVYLITDVLTGKRYVGSAYGKDMIYSRWQDYLKTGHGDNKDLEQLDFDYIKKNFRYSILEIFKSTTLDATIIKREHWWMDLLLTRDKKFGYNN